jgi:hypothetical protein
MHSKVSRGEWRVGLRKRRTWYPSRVTTSASSATTRSLWYCSRLLRRDAAFDWSELSCAMASWRRSVSQCCFFARWRARVYLVRPGRHGAGHEQLARKNKPSFYASRPKCRAHGNKEQPQVAVAASSLYVPGESDIFTTEMAKASERYRVRMHLWRAANVSDPTTTAAARAARQL